jgi:FMN reductase
MKYVKMNENTNQAEELFMSKIAVISGSPTSNSRLYGLVEYVEAKLTAEGHEVIRINVADLPAEALVKAQFGNEELQRATALVNDADGVVIASPVYKASYTGLLKTFLDLLPQTGLKGKITYPLFIGGTIAHLLSIDFALKPVIAALGGRVVLGGVYAIDPWIERLEGGGYGLSEELIERLDRSTGEFIEELHWQTVRAESRANQ